MLNDAHAFSGFAVRDLDAARTFYVDTLGLQVAEENGMLRLQVGGGNPVLVYPKPDHEPAGFTILNFPVADIEQTVADLTSRGVDFEHYEGTPVETDASGIFRGGGPLIAWFTDPSDNVMSVIQE
jgi:catechol 2,3-dioxygenase-like lactoylglutathione lyase family enzyme